MLEILSLAWRRSSSGPGNALVVPHEEEIAPVGRAARDLRWHKMNGPFAVAAREDSLIQPSVNYAVSPSLAEVQTFK